MRIELDQLAGQMAESPTCAMQPEDNPYRDSTILHGAHRSGLARTSTGRRRRWQSAVAPGSPTSSPQTEGQGFIGIGSRGAGCPERGSIDEPLRQHYTEMPGLPAQAQGAEQPRLAQPQKMAGTATVAAISSNHLGA
jgi:hypothetical protein